MRKRAAAALLVLLIAATSAEAEPGLGVALNRAQRRAAEKLSAPGCRLILDDFRDPSGRTLEENLSETGLSAPEFLARLEVRSGRNEDLCRRGHVDAFTSVGGAVVRACPGGSLWTGGDNNRSGANTLIHEMLHALGLEENPPSSVEITRRVRERCGL